MQINISHPKRRKIVDTLQSLHISGFCTSNYVETDSGSTISPRRDNNSSCESATNNDPDETIHAELEQNESGSCASSPDIKITAQHLGESSLNRGDRTASHDRTLNENQADANNEQNVTSDEKHTDYIVVDIDILADVFEDANSEILDLMERDSFRFWKSELTHDAHASSLP